MVHPEENQHLRHYAQRPQQAGGGAVVTDVLQVNAEKRIVWPMGDLQQEIQLREREMMQDILKDLEGVVSEIGKADKFTLILDRSQILFGDQAIDLTNKVIETFNRAKK